MKIWTIVVEEVKKVKPTDARLFMATASEHCVDGSYVAAGKTELRAFSNLVFKMKK